MSLNRGVAALGAVAVVGAATLAVTLPIANHYAPSKPMVQVTSGSNWVQFAPLCWNKGDALTTKQIATCVSDLTKAGQKPTKDTPTVEVAANGTFMINTNEDIAKHGWSAQVPGQQGAVGLVSRTTDQQAGNIPIAQALQASQTGSTQVTVIEGSTDGKTVYGVWAFQVKQKGV
ncbi:hypothetical protein ABH931_001784 [Streptacidiphilus sp. MAP12-33]|uniref:hypothetical protein n=1 Tax=Streptacidiphilus sp. MAP12-33 TaxID=3156266 RepID=UPI003512B50D